MEMSIYNRLRRALATKPYDCRKVISILKQIDEYKTAYTSLNSKKRNYSLEEHTIMVCEMFESYFAETYNERCGIEAFRLLLCLHDIGKPLSLENGDKEHQWKYTVQMIEARKADLPFSENDYLTGISLISDDPLGLYIRNKINIQEAKNRIIKMLNASGFGITVENFFKLLSVYYQTDAGAYTAEGYIGDKDGFFEKPKLEAVFKKDTSGKLCFSKELGRFIFSDDIEDKVALLHEVLTNGR